MLTILPKPKNSQGITIIELLISVFIISAIGTLSVAFYSRFLAQNALDDAANRLVGNFRKAQIYSMLGKQGGTWGVKYTESTKTITLYLTGNSAFDEKFDHNDTITITGFTDVSFAKTTGTTSPATITLTGTSGSKTITINAQGVTSRTN